MHLHIEIRDRKGRIFTITDDRLTQRQTKKPNKKKNVVNGSRGPLFLAKAIFIWSFALIESRVVDIHQMNFRSISINSTIFSQLTSKAASTDKKLPEKEKSNHN